MVRRQQSSVSSFTRRSFVWALGAGAIVIGVNRPPGAYAATPQKSPRPRVDIPPPPDVLIRGITVVDPLNGRKRAGQSILTRHGRIAAVRRNGKIHTTDGVTVIDGDGRYVVPGYVNMHTHAIQAEKPELLMACMLAEGVTSMRQMMGSRELLRARSEHRLPLTQYAPAILAMPGALILPFNAGSAQDVQQEIADQYEQGADFIKMIMVERGVFFAAIDAAHRKGMKIAGHLPPSVTVSESARAGFDCLEHLGTSTNMWIACSRDEHALWAAHDKSMPIPSTPGTPPAAEELLLDAFMMTMSKRLINPWAYESEETVRELRRALRTFDEGKARRLAQTFVRHGTFQSPTMVRLRTQYLMDSPEYQSDPWIGYMSDQARSDYYEVLDRFKSLPMWVRDTFRDAYGKSKRLIRIFHEEGVPLLAATDGQGRVPGQWMQLEFDQLAQSGLSPLEVLRAATTTPARYLKMEGRIGRVQVGADADLVLLASDPLARTRHLGDITAVMRAGHYSTSDELAEVVAAYAAQSPSDGLWAATPASRLAGCGC